MSQTLLSGNTLAPTHSNPSIFPGNTGLGGSSVLTPIGVEAFSETQLSGIPMEAFATQPGMEISLSSTAEAEMVSHSATGIYKLPWKTLPVQSALRPSLPRLSLWSFEAIQNALLGFCRRGETWAFQALQKMFPENAGPQYAWAGAGYIPPAVQGLQMIFQGQLDDKPTASGAKNLPAVRPGSDLQEVTPDNITFYRSTFPQSIASNREIISNRLAKFSPYAPYYYRIPGALLFIKALKLMKYGFPLGAIVMLGVAPLIYFLPSTLSVVYTVLTYPFAVRREMQTSKAMPELNHAWVEAEDELSTLELFDKRAVKAKGNSRLSEQWKDVRVNLDNFNPSFQKKLRALSPNKPDFVFSLKELSRIFLNSSLDGKSNLREEALILFLEMLLRLEDTTFESHLAAPALKTLGLDPVVQLARENSNIEQLIRQFIERISREPRSDLEDDLKKVKQTYGATY